MTSYDVVVIGAGLGGLATAAILTKAGRKVLVIERSNSVGGAASSYKVGDLFVEGSLHETSDPHDPRDPKHDVLTRAGVLDTVTFVPAGALYEARGGPLDTPFVLPDNFEAASAALATRFPDQREPVAQLFAQMRAVIAGDTTDATLSLQDKLDDLFGDDEPIKCALAANLAYYHDDPATLAWTHFATAQGRYLASGGRYVQGGSQRLSSALARIVMRGGGEVALRRVVTSVDVEANTVTHSAKDGSDPKTLGYERLVSNAAPATLAALLGGGAGRTLMDSYADQSPSISLFALTLGLSKPPRAFGFTGYSTQLLPTWLRRLADFKAGTTLMKDEPGDRMPPLSIVDYAAIDSGVPAPPYVLSIFGPDHLSNWDESDMDAYRDKRGRWQDAIVAALDGVYPGVKDAIVASSFNSALSVRQYLNAPNGAVYGFAPSPGAPPPSPKTVLPRLYLSSAYAGGGGYTGVLQSAGLCADLILRQHH
ncbi:MAG: dependent oxidoreductase [Tardiphaga sp.]|nr:dependent oxidoreductase [Tardiphaga sp.]